MDINRKSVLAIISGRPLSSYQIGSELGIGRNDGKIILKLVNLLDELREEKKIEIAIDRNAPTLYEGAPVGPNTFRYYRLDEAEQLKKEGVLSKSREISVETNSREAAQSEGLFNFLNNFLNNFAQKRERRY